MESTEVSKNKRINCYFDGNYSSQKGGRIGCFISDAITGEILSKWGKGVQCKDCFEAELRAFHKLLVHIRKYKSKNAEFRDADIIIMGDNKSLIDCINGEGKMPTYSISKDVIREYEILCTENNVQTIWISRDENELADAVARCKNRKNKNFYFIKQLQEIHQRLEQNSQQIRLLTEQDIITRIEKLDNQLELNNYIMSKLLMMETIKQYNVIDEVCLWKIIEYHQGEEFRTIRNRRFSYEIEGDYLKIKGLTRKIRKEDFQHALENRPIESLGQIKHINGSSYIFAILKDNRISIIK